jgi:hypothetical protein
MSGVLGWRAVGACAAALFPWPGFAQPANDEVSLRQLGFVAGQAVACKLTDVVSAKIVIVRAADAMGYGDDETLKKATDAAESSLAEGCRPLSPQARREFETGWVELRRRTGVK